MAVAQGCSEPLAWVSSGELPSGPEAAGMRGHSSLSCQEGLVGWSWGSLLCMDAWAMGAWAGALCLLKGRGGLVFGVLPEAINS